MNYERGEMTLALETSTARGGVALFRGGELVFSENFLADRSHSSGLFAVIERALAGEGETVGRIVVGLGPGSYAGVRIAIAAGIGISVATGAEMVGVASVLGLGAGKYVAIGDARRGGYWFADVRDGEIIGGPMVVTREELEVRLAEGDASIFLTAKNMARSLAATEGDFNAETRRRRDAEAEQAEKEKCTRQAETLKDCVAKSAKGEELRSGGECVPVFSSEELGLPDVQLRFPRVDRIGRLAIEGRGIHARGVLEPIYLREPHITLPKAIDDC